LFKLAFESFQISKLQFTFLRERPRVRKENKAKDKRLR